MPRKDEFEMSSEEISSYMEKMERKHPRRFARKYNHLQKIKLLRRMIENSEKLSALLIPVSIETVCENVVISDEVIVSVDPVSPLTVEIMEDQETVVEDFSVDDLVTPEIEIVIDVQHPEEIAIFSCGTNGVNTKILEFRCSLQRFILSKSNDSHVDLRLNFHELKVADLPIACPPPEHFVIFHEPRKKVRKKVQSSAIDHYYSYVVSSVVHILNVV
jgi:hypothetical protein